MKSAYGILIGLLLAAMLFLGGILATAVYTTSTVDATTQEASLERPGSAVVETVSTNESAVQILDAASTDTPAVATNVTLLPETGSAIAGIATLAAPAIAMFLSYGVQAYIRFVVKA